MGVSVEIVCVLSQEDVQAVVEKHFNETGDIMLARSLYEELDRVLLVFRLLPATNIEECTAFLQNALQESIIESYEYVISTLISVSLHSVPAREIQMRDFPLASGDAWLPAIDDPCKVFLSIDMMPLTNEQIRWLSDHQATWKYEEW